MPESKPSIDLLVPGLLGPLPSLRELEQAPTAPLLEKCLTRSNVTSTNRKDYLDTLFNLLGFQLNPGQGFPTAPYTLLSDAGEPQPGYWLEAAPVHLRPDGDGLLLFDSGVMEIALDEAKELVELFNNHFSDMPWRLEARDSKRWYLSLEEEPDLTTSTLRDVAGRNINNFMPTGEGAASWRSVMNEIQMLFYSSKVNLLRDGRGQFTINGIWLHGGGRYRDIDSSPYDAIYSDDPLLKGLGTASGIKPAVLPEDSSSLLADQGRSLVVNSLLDRPVLEADPIGWLEALESFQSWLEPLLAGVRFKRLKSLNIYPCEGTCFSLDAASLRRFWRPRRSMSHFLFK